jgi:hypothetical protein
MPASPVPIPPLPSGLDQLRTELPDLAYDLERQGRLDAADVVMMLHARVRELSAPSGGPVPSAAPGNQAVSARRSAPLRPS